MGDKMKKIKRKMLSKKEIKTLREKLPDYLKQLIHKNLPIEIIETEKGEVYIIEDTPILIKVENRFIPHLKYILKEDTNLKKVIVDRGAIKPILNGADIMAPGVTYFDDTIEEEEVIEVREEEKNIPICIGYALVSGSEFNKIKKGRVVKNIHHIKDIWWDIQK